MDTKWQMEERIYNSIHSQHFPSDTSSDSSGRVAHLLLNAHADLRKKTQLLDSIKLEEAQKGSRWLYGILYTIVSSCVCGMTVTIVYYCYKFQICSKMYMLVVADEIETTPTGGRRFSVSGRGSSKDQKRLEKLRQTQKNLQILINTATAPRHSSTQSALTQTSTISPDYPGGDIELAVVQRELEQVNRKIEQEERLLREAETPFIVYPGLPSGSAPPTPM